MAAATIPAMYDGQAKLPWKLLPARQAVAFVPRQPGPEPFRKQEVRPVTRSSDPPPAQAAGQVPATVPAQPQADRSAAIAEQKALAELAVRCMAGDAAAWEQLARTQHRRIYGICYRFTGSQSDAEDLTQEAFFKMYRNLASFDPAKGGFTTWLTTLTRNLLVDNYRRTRLERASDSLDETYDGEDDGATKAERLADGGKTQEQYVSGLELRAQIQAALRQVSPELREAVILRDLEDMDYKEIAEILGIPQGTVKSRISRGRAELARLLKRIEGQVM
jgi:RNA polymerase sigma-70 factor (ECF subfamily)